MGDNEINSYEDIKNNLTPTGEVELFKLGHHGSKNSINEALTKLISPKITIISVGQNDYGHPSQTAINHLKNTNIFRTDKDNSIKIQTNGENYKVFTYNPKKSCWQNKKIKK